MDSGDERPEPNGSDSSTSAPTTFAGDLFLRLAMDGRLVVDAAQADRVIASLERTIELASAQMCRVELAQALTLASVREMLPATERMIIDAAFAEQVTPGRLEEVLQELPKYVKAFRIASAASRRQRHVRETEIPGPGTSTPLL
jgi:hypothetical protein